MALPAEECPGWLLLHTGSPFVFCFSCLLLRSSIFPWSNQIKQSYSLSLLLKVFCKSHKLVQVKIENRTKKPKTKADCSESPVQDTCVALQALSEYAILSYVGGVNLTISLASTNLDFQETFELNRENKKLLQSAKVTTSVFDRSVLYTTSELMRCCCCSSTSKSTDGPRDVTSQEPQKRFPSLLQWLMNIYAPEPHFGIKH